MCNAQLSRRIYDEYDGYASFFIVSFLTSCQLMSSNDQNVIHHDVRFVLLRLPDGESISTTSETDSACMNACAFLLFAVDSGAANQ